VVEEKTLTKVDDIDHTVSTSTPFKYYHMNGLSPMDWIEKYRK
jgi:hypothetical protein